CAEKDQPGSSKLTAPIQTGCLVDFNYSENRSDKHWENKRGSYYTREKIPPTRPLPWRRIADFFRRLVRIHVHPLIIAARQIEPPQKAKRFGLAKDFHRGACWTLRRLRRRRQ